MAKSKEETFWAEEDMSRYVSRSEQLLENDGADPDGANMLHHDHGLLQKHIDNICISKNFIFHI